MGFAQRFGHLCVLSLLGVATYYSGAGFTEAATMKTSIAPLFMVVHVLLLPLTLSFAGLYAFAVVKDPTLTWMGRQALLLSLLALDLVVLSLSGRADLIKKCFPFLIDQCTLPQLLPHLVVKDVLATAPSWLSIATTNTMALIYFSLGLLVLPGLSWQILRQCQQQPTSSNGKTAAALSPGQFSVDVIPRPSAVDAPAVNPLWRGQANNSSSSSSQQLKGPGVCTTLTLRERYAALVNFKRRQTLLGLAGAFLLVFPFVGYLTTRLGNAFEWMYPAGIAVWTGAHTVSPVIPTASAADTGTDTDLKFFPQLIAYYGSLYSVAVVALVAQVDRRVHSWLHRKIQLTRYTQLSPTNGQALLLAAVLGLLAFIFHYVLIAWYFQARPWFSEHFENERWARSFGQVSAAVLGLTLLPVSRNSVWSSVFGVPWEVMIFFHRYMSYTFLVLVALHMLTFWLLFIRLGKFPSALFSSPNTYQDFDFTITPTSAIMLFVVFPAMGILTRPHYRRKAFEWFYYVHHYVALVLLLITLWHANFGWDYVLPGMLFWAFDNTIRFLKACKNAQIVEAKVVTLESSNRSLAYPPDSGSGSGSGSDPNSLAEVIVQLSFLVDGTPVQAEMGQYVFISLPDISGLQMHPFSLSSSPLDGVSTVTFRAQGTGSFTREAAALVAQKLASAVTVASDDLRLEGGGESSGGGSGSLGTLQVVVDGPYGLPLSYNPSRVPSLLLLAGGIGITPLHSIFRTLLLLAEEESASKAIETLTQTQTRRVRIVWGVRDSEIIEIESFLDTWRLSHLRSQRSHFANTNTTYADFSAAFYCSKPGYAREMLKLDAHKRISRAAQAQAQAYAQAQHDQESLCRERFSSFESQLPIPGRMDIAAELRSLMGVDGALCIVCGPPSMVQECLQVATVLGVTCRGETFQL